jgi:hypothetical protein
MPKLAYIAGQGTKRWNIGDHWRYAARHSLQQRIAATFAVAARYKEIRRAHQPFNTFVGYLSKQMDASSKMRIAMDATLHIGQQRCVPEHAPQLQTW